MPSRRRSSRTHTTPPIRTGLGSVPKRRITEPTHIRKSSEDCGLYKDLGLYKNTLERVKPIIIENNGRLDVEERTSLACAYKQILNGLRTQLNPTSPQQTAQTGDKSSAVTVEINRVCNEVLDLLRRWLLPAAAVGEESVFYWKMSADFHRYLCDTSSEGSSEDHASASVQAYTLAFLHAKELLNPIHQTRLGLALNFSVFYHDVYGSPLCACYIAKFAFDAAVAYAGENPGEASDESLGVMQILQNNMTFWENEIR